MVQLNYDDQGGASTLAIEGLLADSGPHNIVTQHVDIAAGIPFGFGTVRGTLGDDVVLPTAAGFTFTGVALHKAKTDPNNPSTPSAQWEEDEAASILIQGRVWVVVEQEVLVNDDVYLRHSGEVGNEAPGRFRVDADTAGADQITQARWVTLAAIDSFAIVEINIP